MFCIGQSFICSNCPMHRFISLAQVPLPNLGFSLMGFITFHFYLSIKLVSLTLLQALSMDFSLGICQPSAYAAQAYRFTWHNHYIRRRMCEHGLSSDFSAIVLMLFLVNQFFQTGYSL